MSEIVRRYAVPYAYHFPCFDFVDENGERKKVTACLVAISFYQDELGRDRITYACKNGKGCRCPYCNYTFKEE
jgi:hypothetical protein